MPIITYSHFRFFSDYVAPLPEIYWLEDFLRERWLANKEVKSLRYLWKPLEIIVRKVHWITRRTDPRWRAERWKARS